ncbi:MAG: phosphodiester glycosidase family protein, partial [Candidatus Sericytochromatia bacterium]
IGGFPALYTRDQLRTLDQDIRSGVFAKRASYGGASQADSVSRSFIGIAADGKVLLVAAGHGSERGKGVSMAEGARLLRELGAVEAYILDGGGSTTIFARGVEHARTDGRQVWSYLGIRARP